MGLAAPMAYTSPTWTPNMGMPSPYQTFSPEIWANQNTLDWQSLNQQIGDAATSAMPTAVTAAPVSTPSVASAPGGAATPTFGWNMPTIGLGLYGLNTIGNLWSSFQANKIAKDQLAWAKEFGNANLNNSIKSYNTQLTDRANTRMSSSGWTPEQAAAYVQKNQVSR